MTRLNTGKRVHTKLGLLPRPAQTCVQGRILSRMNLGDVRQCGVSGVGGFERKPHYLSASEQVRVEACAPLFLRNIIAIMVEMGRGPIAS